MPRRPRSVKQKMDQLSAELREQGLTWGEVAAVFHNRWNLNSRQAFREAHRHTQIRVTEIWNSLWPYEPLTVRKLGSWEAWPSRTGNEPPLAALNKLARIYQCRAADLVDGEDHRNADKHSTRESKPPARPLVVATGPEPSAIGALLAGLPHNQAPSPLGPLRDAEFEQLVQTLAIWAMNINRRDVLALIGAAATAAYASPLLARLNDDELNRIKLAVAEPSRVDEATIGHIEAILHHCRRQEDALGPRAVLETVLAQHQMVRSLLGGAGEHVRPRLLSLQANISRSIGWMLFNLNDMAGADYYYAKARSAAHGADDDAMCSFVLSNWSQLAAWRGDARLAVEHAFGALAWGQRAGSKLLVSYACDVGARAFAAVVRRSAKGDRHKDHARCMKSLDQARRELVFADDGDKGEALLHFYDEGLHLSTRTMCLLDLDDANRALPLAQETVNGIDSRFTRNLAFARLDLTRALAMSTTDRDIDAACVQLGEAVELTQMNTSPRLVGSVLHTRELLSPWQQTKAVAELDERLKARQLTA